MQKYRAIYYSGNKIFKLKSFKRFDLILYPYVCEGENELEKRGREEAQVSSVCVQVKG